MNRNCCLQTAVLFSFAILLFSGVSAQESRLDLKVMTYNIWNGFDWGKDTIRKDRWVQWIQDKNPDVLALQELCGYTEEQLKVDAAQWGHPYVLLLKTEGYPTGLTSREPIEIKKRRTEDLWHGLLHGKTFGIDFFVVHLSPADSDFRLKEANIIVEEIRASKSDHYIVLGDFNAHSPFDVGWLKNNHDLLFKYGKDQPMESVNLRLGAFDYAVMSRFLALPTMDVGMQFIDIADRYTYPSPVLIGTWREDREEVVKTRERIDYVLASPTLSTACRQVVTYNKGEAASLSDHYPIMVEFSFRGEE